MQTVGVAGATVVRLQDVDEADGNNTVILIADFDDLVDTLLDLVNVADITGNVLLGNNNAVGGGDDDRFGADDGGYIKSITIDGTIYTFDGVGTITVSGANPGAQLLENGGTFIEVLTDLGGTFTFHFAASSPDLAGAWGYSAPNPGNESFSYTIVDGDGDEDTATLGITITATTSPNTPTIPGGNREGYSIPENTTFVFDVNATDPDGDTLTYSIVNTAGTDFNKFTIDPNTGVLAFISAPNFESPNDVGGTDNNNNYIVNIQVSDGVHTDTQNIGVTVTNVTVEANNDVVRTAVSGPGSTTVVPEWALLHDDTSSVGKILDITATGSVSDLTSASLVTNPGSVTIVNNDVDGGSFVYTASDGIETDTATVTVQIDADPTGRQPRRRNPGGYISRRDNRGR